VIEVSNLTTYHLTAPQFSQPNLLCSFILACLNLRFHVPPELRSDVEDSGHDDGPADKKGHTSSKKNDQCRNGEEVKTVPVAENRKRGDVDVECYRSRNFTAGI
jgi:hypothetical protein